MQQDNTHFALLLNQRDDWEKKWKGGKPSKKELAKRAALEFAIHRESNRLDAEQLA